jgi:hypothetical protein
LKFISYIEISSNKNGVKMATRHIILFIISLTVCPLFATAQTTVFEGNIMGEFTGWSGETLFEMSDGTFWLQASFAYTYSYAFNPRAKIVKSGSNHYLTVERVNGQLAVKPLAKVIKSRINGEFEGFSGDTIYALMDGSVWQQSVYKYAYKYAYSPSVFLYQNGGTWKMQVADITVSVIRLK